MTGRRSLSLWVRCCPGNIYNTSPPPPPPPPPACPAPRPPCPPPPWLMTCNLGTNSETQKPLPRPRLLPRQPSSLRSHNPCSRSTASRRQPRGSPSWKTLLLLMILTILRTRLMSATRSCPCWTTASSPATPTTGPPSTAQTGSGPEYIRSSSQQWHLQWSRTVFTRGESEWTSTGLLLALNALFIFCEM